MYGIVLSAIFSALRFLLSSVLVKFGVFFGLFFVVQGFIGILGGMLPNSSSLNGSFSSIPPSVWFFLDLFAVTAGVPMIITAFVTRFLIRRIPVIG